MNQNVLLVTRLIDAERVIARLGEVLGESALASHDALFRDCLAERGGVELARTVDGFEARFGDTSGALNCALKFQKLLAGLALSERLDTRIGVHLESVVGPKAEADESNEGAEIEGTATARALADLAGAGQVLLTRDAFDAARSRAETLDEPTAIRWLGHGLYQLEGEREPIEVFEAGLAGLSALISPPKAFKAHMGEEIIRGWRPAAAQALPGRDGWTLERRLCYEPFGESWLAAADQTRERRVFKFIFRATARDEAVERQARLAILRQISAERDDIERLHGFELTSAPYYLEMDARQGAPLPRWIEKRGGSRAVTLKERLLVAAQAAEGIGAAHYVGLFHDEIGPESIRVVQTHDGRTEAYLAGFALCVPGVSRKPPNDCAAPERASGKPPTVQSDIFAFGQVLWRLIVGEFGNGPGEGWEAGVRSPELAELLTECLDPIPSQRIADGQELADRLRQIAAMSTDQIAAGSESPDQSARPMGLGNPRFKPLATIATVAVVVALLVLVFIRPWPRSGEPIEIAEIRSGEGVSNTDSGNGFMRGDRRRIVARHVGAQPDAAAAEIASPPTGRFGSGSPAADIEPAEPEPVVAEEPDARDEEETARSPVAAENETANAPSEEKVEARGAETSTEHEAEDAPMETDAEPAATTDENETTQGSDDDKPEPELQEREIEVAEAEAVPDWAREATPEPAAKPVRLVPVLVEPTEPEVEEAEIVVADVTSAIEAAEPEAADGKPTETLIEFVADKPTADEEEEPAARPAELAPDVPDVPTEQAPESDTDIEIEDKEPAPETDITFEAPPEEAPAPIETAAEIEAPRELEYETGTAARDEAYDPAPNDGRAIFADDFSRGARKWVAQGAWQVRGGGVMRLRTILRRRAFEERQPPREPMRGIEIMAAGSLELDDYALEIDVEPSYGAKFLVVVRCQGVRGRALGAIVFGSTDGDVFWGEIPTKPVIDLGTVRAEVKVKKVMPAPVSLEPGKRYTVRVEASGADYRAYINGRFAGRYRNEAYNSGLFGFAYDTADRADSPVYRAVRVFNLDAPE